MVLVCLLTVFFLSSLSLSFLTFLLVLCGVGDDLGFFQKIGLLTCVECLGLWFKGFREGGAESIHCIAMFYYMCGVVGEVVQGGEGGNTIAKLPKYD